MVVICVSIACFDSPPILKISFGSIQNKTVNPLEDIIEIKIQGANDTETYITQHLLNSSDQNILSSQ